MAFFTYSCRILCYNIKTYSISSGDEGIWDGEKTLQGKSLEALEIVEILSLTFDATSLYWLQMTSLTWDQDISRTPTCPEFPTLLPMRTAAGEDPSADISCGRGRFLCFLCQPAWLNLLTILQLPLNVTILSTTAVKMAVSLASSVCCYLKFYVLWPSLCP